MRDRWSETDGQTDNYEKNNMSSQQERAGGGDTHLYVHVFSFLELLSLEV